MEEKNNPKFCSDYFIPVGELRAAAPSDFDKATTDRLIYKGNKAIMEGKVCLVVNAGGMGEENNYFYNSKIFEKPNSETDLTYFEILI
jgi:hypothetical protein